MCRKNKYLSLSLTEGQVKLSEDAGTVVDQTTMRLNWKFCELHYLSPSIGVDPSNIHMPFFSPLADN